MKSLFIFLAALAVAQTPPAGTPRGAQQYADGCGGASWRTSAPPAITVAVTPPTASLQAGQSVQLTAATNEGGVSWAVAPAVGSVSATGLYTAPLAVPAQQAVTVTATSQCAAVAASAVVTLMPTVVVPPPVPGVGGVAAWSKVTAIPGEDLRDAVFHQGTWFALTRTAVYTTPDPLTASSVWTIQLALTVTNPQASPRFGFAPDGTLLLSGYVNIPPSYFANGTWTRVTTGATDRTQTQFITNPIGELLFATYNNGKVFRSIDNGRAYSQLAQLPAGAFGMARIGSDVWVGHEKGVRRSQDNGATWPEFWDSPITGSNITDFAATPLGVLVVARDAMKRWNGSIFESISGLDKTIPNWANYMQAHVASDGVIYLTAEFDRVNSDKVNRQPGVWKSIDGSQSWAKINGGIDYTLNPTTGNSCPLPVRFLEVGGKLYFVMGRAGIGGIYVGDVPVGTVPAPPPPPPAPAPAPTDNAIALDPALFQLYSGEDPGQKIAWAGSVMFTVTGAPLPQCATCRHEPGVYWQAYTYGFRGAKGWAYLDRAAARPATTENVLCIEARMDRDIPADTSPDHPHTAEIGTYFRSRTDPDVYQQGDHGYNFINPSWRAGVWQTVCVDVSKPTYAISHGGFGGVIPGASGRTLTRFYFDSQKSHTEAEMSVRKVYLRNRVATDSL